MNRNFWLLLTILMASTMLLAQDESKTSTISGWICNSKCVVQKADTATCEKTCTEKDGEAVFVDDKGKIFKISNQPNVLTDMGKHGKMKYMMDKDHMMEAHGFEIAEPTY